MSLSASLKSEQCTDAPAPAFPWLGSYAPEVKWDLDIPAEPLYAAFDRSVAQYADRPAIRFAGHEYTYAALGRLIDRAARGLQDRGVGPGVKVGLFMPNAAAMTLMYYAILKAGGTVVNYNPVYIERDLIAQIEDSETDILVTLDAPPLLDKAAGLTGKTRIRALIVCPARGDLAVASPAPATLAELTDAVWFHDLVSSEKTPDPVQIDPRRDIAVLQYTGGTTGVPKGAALSHANLVANARQMAHWFHVAEAGQDSIVVVLPLFHVFAMTVCMNMPLSQGMTMLVLPQFGVGEVLDVIRDEKPAFMAGVPTMFIALANDSRAAGVDFSSLKFCLSGGAPLPADVKRVFETRTGARLVAEGYGLTESSPVATCNPLSRKARAGSIGLPIPGTVIEIISLEDGETVLPAGGKGEIAVRGPQVMQGYYNKPEETAAVLRHGRLHTGDVGYMDEDGFVYIVDRVKDMVLVGGYNVYPRHIEEVLYTHPAVEECIVAGVPDKLRGEAVHAWIKQRAGESVSPETLKAFLQDKLSPIEMPRKIIIRDQPLPKTAVGKLSKKDLLAEEGIVRK